MANIGTSETHRCESLRWISDCVLTALANFVLTALTICKPVMLAAVLPAALLLAAMGNAFAPACLHASEITTTGYNPWEGGCRSSRYYRSCPAGRLWFGSGILGWSVKSSRPLPPLVTVSPAGTPLTEAGVLGESTTRVVFGGKPLFGDMRVGGQLRGGWWFDRAQTLGIEASYFAIDGENVEYVRSGNRNILARPFFNLDSGQQEARLIAFPATNVGGDTVEFDGGLDASIGMEFSGGDVIVRRLMSGTSNHRVEFIAGYRHLYLNDDLTVMEEISTATQQASATIIEVGRLTDKLQTTNRFHGAEIGFIANRWWERLSVQGVFKLGIGGTSSRSDVRGRTETTVTTIPAIGSPTSGSFRSPTGFLAQPSNIGTIVENRFAVSTEIQVNLEYALNCQTRLQLGYTFIHWSHVARIEDAMEIVIDPSQNRARPRLRFDSTDFWAQGLTGSFIYQF